VKLTRGGKADDKNFDARDLGWEELRRPELHERSSDQNCRAGAGLAVGFNKQTGVLMVSCLVCDKEILGSRSPKARYSNNGRYCAPRPPRAAGLRAGCLAWYRQGAGLRLGQLHLGETHRDGLGVPQHYVSAHMWFNLAASQGLGG
jgi:TPR repeat protein